MCMAISDKCINIWSYGCICVRCGCCEPYNHDEKDRLKRRIKYYQERINEECSEGKIHTKISIENIQFFKENIAECNRRLQELEEEDG